MPFVYISNLARDDATVKLIFDHLRNLGIVSLVGVAAVWKFKHLPSSGWGYILALTIACSLAVCTFALFFLNYEHFIHRLNSTPYRKVLKVAITTFYSLVATGLLTYLFLHSNP
jgi:hypothetical protein